MSAPDVAIVSPYPNAGERHGGFSGVASYTAQLASALAAEGASVEVLAPHEPGQPSRGQDGAVTVLRCFARGRRALPDALAAARAGGARTVHLQHETFLYGGPSSVPPLAPALARLSRSPARSVVTMHHVVAGSAVDRGFTRLHRVAAPAALARVGLAGVHAAISRLADRVIVHEPAFADTIRGAAVIPHGVESVPTPDRAEARARLGLEADRLAVLCFGFIAPYKGLEPALQAAAAAGPAVELIVAGGEHPRLVAGGDGYAAELRERHPHARFTGYVPDADVAGWFAAADVALFLYPRPVSTSGGLALAFAHGTAVLLSPELAATTGAPQALVAPRDAAALADRLRLLAENTADLQGLRDGARELGGDRAWSAVARRHLDIYAGAH